MYNQQDKKMKELFSIRGFNPCESLLRHTPEQLRTFLRRMKKLNFNSIIIHYDYGWKRYKDIILEECRNAGVEITLMTFGPRTFYRYTDWKKEFFARKEDGTFFTEILECETFPCRFAPGAIEAYEEGAAAWLRELPPEIKRIHMRAADGRDYCCCPRCRQMPCEERWNPFIEAFVRAVHAVRPDLKMETDVYTRRYDIPSDTSAFAAMDRIMFDTFPRTPTFPLGSTDDLCTRGHMRRAYGSGNEPESLTANDAMLQKIREWNHAFPGKVYIHENVMKQGYRGNFQYGTASYLEDLKTLHALGISGILFEAYEPGYGAFAELFETLSRAMMGEEINYTPSALELLMRKKNMEWFCSDPDMDLTPYISDLVLLKNQQFYQKRVSAPTLDWGRDYINFALEHSDRLDPFAIAFGIMRNGKLSGAFSFKTLSPEAERFLRSRKLWDFMEDIPEDQDPRAVTRAVVDELLQKVY